MNKYLLKLKTVQLLTIENISKERKGKDLCLLDSGLPAKPSSGVARPEVRSSGACA